VGLVIARTCTIMTLTLSWQFFPWIASSTSACTSKNGQTL
jgi:hypothetical protein